MQAFATEIPETTKIIIAQRIASVQDADLIVVMDNGRIDGLGTHEELLQANQIYREVYESQTKGGADDARMTECPARAARAASPADRRSTARTFARLMQMLFHDYPGAC